MNKITEKTSISISLLIAVSVLFGLMAELYYGMKANARDIDKIEVILNRTENFQVQVIRDLARIKDRLDIN